MSAWEHGAAEVNGLRLHYVTAGAGPLVVLLHGFPEFWYSWRHQIPALAAAGFRVLAPDMRGYNLSDKPAGIGSYRVEALVGDLVGLIRHVDEPRAHVVGHDWGGVVAWYAAMLQPEVVAKLVVINAPHPVAFARELRRSTQALRSWYAGFFQLPWLPEAIWRLGGRVLLRRALPRPAFSDGDIRQYTEALHRPGALTATINYYRAAVRYPPPRPRRISAPTLLLWGDRDPFLVQGLTRDLEELVPGIRVEHLPDVNHWVQNISPERVNRALVEFLG